MSVSSSIQALYVAYFGRPADVAGLDYWTTVVNNAGGSTAAVSAAFAASAEYKADYANLTPYQVVAAVYQNLFGHQPDTAGLEYWGDLLNAGTLNISTIVTNIAAGAQSTDLTAYNDKVTAAGAFTTALLNGTAAQILSYTGAAANAVAQTFLAGVTGDATLATSTTVAALAATVANLAKAAPVTTFTLTTGVDNLVATGVSGNTFYGALDNTTGTTASTATLGGADTVTGLGTVNTLVLTDAVSTGYDAIPVGAVISGIQTVTLNTAGNAGNLGTSSFDVSGITGVTSVTVLSAGNHGDAIKAAVTTNITDTSRATTDAVTTTGGNNVTITNNDGAVTVGGATGNPAGAVVVTNAALANTTIASVDGGTSVTVNETGAAIIKVDTNVASTGAITVTDTGALTGGSAIIIGSISGANATAAVSTASAPTGAVTVNNTFTAVGTGGTNGFSVGGGSSITVSNTFGGVTAAETAALAVPGATAITVTGGTITAVGGATTTAVTLNQTTAATTNTTAAAASGGVTTTTPAILGTPGVAAVAASSSTTSVTAAKVASVIITDGADVVTDVNGNSATAVGTIATVTANNYSTLNVYDNSLATLNATGGGAISITSALAAATNATTALALNLNKVSGTFSDVDTPTVAGTTYKTLNVTTSGAASTLTTITDAALTTLNVAGTQVLTVNTVPTTVTTIAVSGSAGFSDNGTLASDAALTSFTTTSSGKITATLSSTQSFVGSTGQDVISVTAPSTVAVTGGSATNNEIIVNGAQQSMTNITKFSTYGATNATGTYDFSVLTGFNAIDVQSVAGAVTLTKVTPGTALNIDALNSALGFVVGDPITYQTNDASGASESVTLTVGSSSNALALTIASPLLLQDTNLNGIGTVNLVSNTSTTGNTINSLTDNGLSNLTVTGAKPVTIVALTESTTQATSFTLNDAAGTKIGTFTDANLGNLTFTGSVASSITTALVDSAGFLTITDNNAKGVTIAALTDVGAAGALSLQVNFAGADATTLSSLADTSATTTSLTVTDSATAAVGVTSVAANATLTTETFTNTGSATLTVGTDVNVGIASLTLSGNVAYSNTTETSAAPVSGLITPVAGAHALYDAVTTGVTVAGSTDNAHVSLVLQGTAGTAGASHYDTIALGNGNNLIVDGAVAGTVNVSVGTGSNLISLGAAATDVGIYNVTLGTHTATSGIDQIIVGANNAATFNSAATLVLTGGVTGDVIQFLNDAASLSTALTATSTTSVTTAAAAVALIEAAAATAGVHGVAYGVFGGNTYVAETLAGTSAQGDVTIVELVGVHTVTAGTGYVAIAS